MFVGAPKERKTVLNDFKMGRLDVGVLPFSDYFTQFVQAWEQSSRRLILHGARSTSSTIFRGPAYS